MRMVTFLLTVGLFGAAAEASGRPLESSADGAATAQRQIGVRESTDQTVNVQKGMRIDMTGVNGCHGLVTVKTWDRDAVRVRAEHSTRTSVQITPRDQVLLIRSDARALVGIDYELTVPAWMGFTAGSPFCSVDIDGLNGAIVIETVEGDIELKNVGGATTAKSIEGDVVVEGSRARLQVSTIEGDIAISRASGEILAESTEGDVTLRSVQAAAVEVSTIEGDIIFDGTFMASGRYLFTSHEGDLRLWIPEQSNATISMRTFGNGKLDTTLPLKPQLSAARGRRATYTIGNGSAQVEIETFEGTVVIRRPGEESR